MIPLSTTFRCWRLFTSGLLLLYFLFFFFFFSSRRRHTRCGRDWSSDVCSSDLLPSPNMADLLLAKAFVRRVLDAHECLREEEVGHVWTGESGAHRHSHHRAREIGRASCRERV